MIEHHTKFRIRYAETDQMGYVYYGNYAAFFEVGRVELLRHLGVSYKDLEASGIILPVREMNVKYIRPARYDDEVTLKTSVIEKPGVRIVFHYEMHSAKGDVLNEAVITLIFADRETGKPRPAPAELIELFEAHGL